MGRTINRPITSVNTPSKSDVQNYFFTHANWKGLNNDKNFLTVDQETFSECKNVYMDSEGLLRSRPSMKIKTVEVTLNGENVILSDILYCERFANVTVYKVKKPYTHALIFSPDNSSAMQVSCSNDVKLLNVEGKIFVFSEQSLHYYDIDTNTYHNADEFIYVPVTKTYKEGFWNDLEPVNEFTTSCIHRYLFDNIADEVNFNILVGKHVSVTINDDVYYIDFVKDNEIIFLEDKKVLTEDNFIKIANVNFPLISTCEGKQFLLSYHLSEGFTNSNDYAIYYTADGLVFKELPEVKGVIAYPKITSDGHYAYCLKSDDLYMCSLVDTESNYFDTWTPVLKTYYSDFYNKDVNILDSIPWNRVDSIAEVHSIDNFVIYFSRDTTLGVLDRGVLACDDGECSYKFISKHSKYSSFTVSNPIINNNIDIDDNSKYFDDVTLSFSDSESLSKNLLKIYFSDPYITKSSQTDITDNFYFILHATIVVAIQRTTGQIVRKYYSQIEQRFNVYYNDYTNRFDADSVTLDLKGLSCTIALNVSVLTNYSLLYNFTIPTLKFNGLFDFEYDGDEYSISNTYQYVPNIQYGITSYNSSYLVDVGIVYKLDVTNSTNHCLYKNSDNNLSLMNGLRITDDFIKHTKTSSSTPTLYTYHVESLSRTSTELLPKLSNKYDVKCIIRRDGSVVTNEYLYVNSKSNIPLLFEIMPLSFEDSFYAYTNNTLYSNDISRQISIDEVITGTNNYFVPELIAEIGSFYLSKDKTLYISSYPADGKFKWYLPKISTEEFDSEITNLHPISSSEMAVFLRNSIYYIKRSEEFTKTGINVYLYYKSKIQVGSLKGSDVITSFDGQYVIFPSTRGLVALTYQELTASTEQVLNFLSDSIHKTFSEYTDSAIKLYKYDYWIACYKEGSKSLLVFDIRNNSWWPIELCDAIKDIVTIDDKPVILGTNLYYLDSSENDYYDFDGNKSQIDWSVKSQKLHLSAPNNYKHISNITITSVLDNPSKEALDLDLIVTNYRKRMNTSDAENFVFDVDTVRVYVKRLNYSKVNEFQYELKCDEYNDIRIPLSLSSISIKYKISGQVR